MSGFIRRNRNEIIVVVVTLIFILAFAVSAGCQGKSTGRFTGETRVELPDGTIVHRIGKSSGNNIAPPNASLSSPLDVGVDGVRSSTGPVWSLSTADRLAEKSAIFYVAAIAAGIGAVVAWWFGSKTLAIGAGIAAACFAATPTILDKAGVWIAAVGVLALLGAAAYVGVRAFALWRRKKEQAPGIAKLAREHKTDEALAALRAVDPTVDRAFKGTE